VVDDLVDEGTVGAILQQPAHQIGEQVAVGAHGRIDTAASAPRAVHVLVQRLAHAVQPLKLECVGFPAMCRTAATVCALWVANCGKMRSVIASNLRAQAM
jgi:hypothetical protein